MRRLSLNQNIAEFVLYSLIFDGRLSAFYMEVIRLIWYLKIKKMMGFLAIGFCWAHKTVEWKKKVIKPLKTKAHGRLEKNILSLWSGVSCR